MVQPGYCEIVEQRAGPELLIACCYVCSHPMGLPMFDSLLLLVCYGVQHVQTINGEDPLLSEDPVLLAIMAAIDD